jgi:hypothetical protein
MAVAMGGATPKDDGTGSLSQSGGNGDGDAERLVGSPPPMLLLADIFRGRREAAWKRCCLAAMSTMTMMVQMMTGGSKRTYPL